MKPAFMTLIALCFCLHVTGADKNEPGTVTCECETGDEALASPKILLYHPFDRAAEKPTVATGPLEITAGPGLQLRPPAIQGKAAWFAETATEASLRIDLPALAQTDSGPSSSSTIRARSIMCGPLARGPPQVLARTNSTAPRVPALSTSRKAAYWGK